MAPPEGQFQKEIANPSSTLQTDSSIFKLNCNPHPIFPQLSLSRKHFATKIRFFLNPIPHTLLVSYCALGHRRTHQCDKQVSTKSPDRPSCVLHQDTGWLPGSSQGLAMSAEISPFHQQPQNILLDLSLPGTRKHPFLSKSFSVCPASWIRFFFMEPCHSIYCQFNKYVLNAHWIMGTGLRVEESRQII